MAVDFFLKLDGIQGESIDEKHKDEIQVLSFSWGATQTTSVHGSGGSGAGKASLSDFSIMKYYDKASAPLFKALTKGDHIAKGTLTAVKAGGKGEPFLTIDFGELFVTSQQVSASSEVPSESVSLSYNTIKITYSVQKADGTMNKMSPVSFNLATNVTS